MYTVLLGTKKHDTSTLAIPITHYRTRKPSEALMIYPGKQIHTLVLLANTQQLIFSALDYLYNDLLTCMVMVAEYNDFAIQRKPLQVSWPKGEQRSTYYLGVPYRYSLSIFGV